MTKWQTSKLVTDGNCGTGRSVITRIASGCIAAIGIARDCGVARTSVLSSVVADADSIVIANRDI